MKDDDIDMVIIWTRKKSQYIDLSDMPLQEMPLASDIKMRSKSEGCKIQFKSNNRSSDNYLNNEIFKLDMLMQQASFFCNDIKQGCSLK